MSLDKGFKIVLYAVVIIGRLRVPGTINGGGSGHDFSSLRKSNRSTNRTTILFVKKNLNCGYFDSKASALTALRWLLLSGRSGAFLSPTKFQYGDSYKLSITDRKRVTVGFTCMLSRTSVAEWSEACQVQAVAAHWFQAGINNDHNSSFCWKDGISIWWLSLMLCRRLNRRSFYAV